MNSLKLKKFTDKLAEYIITIAGVAVIVAMFVMLALIVREAAPLFLPSRQTVAGTVALPSSVKAGDVLALGVEADLREQTRVAGAILRDGSGGFSVLTAGAEAGGFTFQRLPDAPEGAAVQAVETFDNNCFSVLWDNGMAALYTMTVAFTNEDDGSVTARPSFTRVFAVAADAERGALFSSHLRGDAGNYRAVFVHDGGEVVEKSLTPGKGLANRGKSVAGTKTVVLNRGGKIISAAMNSDGRLYLGNETGDIISVDFSGGRTDARQEVTPAFRDRRPVTSLTFLSGGNALAVGDAQGGVSVWSPRREEGEFRLRPTANWQPAADAAVTAFTISGRDRGFMTLSADGGIRWLYSTNGRTLLAMPADRPRATALAMNERADNLVTLHSDGGVSFHALRNSYPEAGLAGFFARLYYEGYEQAEYVWQSTGSDTSEPKLSLVPIIWGSVKAAIYALIFATPIALAAAMYLSQFAHPQWRARLKPAVEMLAAVPSVVIGFLAALWLAPVLERYLGFVSGYWQYDQRNSLVIAIAMGFAVIPTVFSLAEDAISAVPPSLSAASLALGASKWQTVMRVVLPTASPGIFTAVMLGFGRAVGETMIVLMAAGNTPIISLSPFSGMRTLSANIAVEMPEAPIGGTLYRTLFLCALVLFVMTFAINTVAEVFRHRLRRRYGRI